MTPVDIANLALTKVGAEGVLTTLTTPACKEARLCNTHYDQARRAVLRAYPWNFAKTRVVLDEVTDAPAWGFTNAFDLPDDCLRVLGIEDDGVAFKTEGDTILTDAESVNLYYIADVESPDIFDSMFVECLATYLAHTICYALTQSSEREAALLKEYLTKLPKARHVDSSENSTTSIVASELDEVRIGPNRGYVRDPQT